MARVRVNSMFTDHLIVCREKRSEWKSLNLGFPLGATDNLVEKTDIYWARFCQDEYAQVEGHVSNCLPSSESDEASSVKARRCEDIGGIEKSRAKARLSHLDHTGDGPKNHREIRQCWRRKTCVDISLQLKKNVPIGLFWWSRQKHAPTSRVTYVTF
jgi:hypothetical protein